MSNAIAGTAFTKIGGRQVALKGDHTIKPGSLQREGIAGQDGVHGYKETPSIPGMKMKVSTTQAEEIKAFQDITNETITSELVNGRVYVLRNAWFAGELEINTMEGEVELEFEGLSCEELSPA